MQTGDNWCYKWLPKRTGFTKYECHIKSSSSSRCPSQTWPDCKNHILELYPNLFDGVGTMKHTMVKLDVDQTAVPVVQPPWKVPQAMVEPLKKEIERMEHLKVVWKLGINEAIDWCHNLVLVRKPNGSLHVCLDPRTINNTLRLNVHNSRTFQDITSSIRHEAKVSKIDTNSGFWTIPMDANSDTVLPKCHLA